MKDMLNRGVCRLLSDQEMKAYNGPKYYIAHHEIIKPESKSTPCRIVFNSSSSFKGHILNDYYVKGPPMLNYLLGVLIRFCQENIAIVGDIAKMYHSIDIPLIDQMTHRFLWRDLNEEKEPQTYVMKVVNFGDRPSGSIAIAALQKTAKMSEAEFPDSCRVIERNSYMDDILHSSENVEKAELMKETITKVLAKWGFNIKNWISSEEDRKDPIKLLENSDVEDYNERVLGMLWNPLKDEFLFKVKLNFSIKSRKIHDLPNLHQRDLPAGIPDNLTKRLILSQINRIYDPRGLLAPFTVRAKIMMRRLWARDRKIDWDDPIPIELLEQWRIFFTELFEVEKLSFRRCLKPENSIGNPTLIMFSDGSEDAFATVAYARWSIGGDKFKSTLIASKNRIAPIKIVNIVRLELCGAVLSKRLRVFIESEMDYKFTHVIHIVDSEIVKAMIGKQSYGFRTFAANRIGEIQGSTQPEEWYWVPGDVNIADYATRGKHPRDLGEGSLWQTGPKFLELPIEQWPVKQYTGLEDLPDKINPIHLAQVEIEDSLAKRFDLSRFSKLPKLLNTTARILKLYSKYRGKRQNNEECKGLTADDVKDAERFWVIEAQRELKTPMKLGKMDRLTPRFKDGYIVVGGRTKRWVAATWNHQEFILLPNLINFLSW